MITTEQKVQVAKDRAADELIDLVGDGYWNRTNEEKLRIQEIGRLLSLVDNSEETLTALDSYINGEEELFFVK
jgi:hypothetical protein